MNTTFTRQTTPPPSTNNHPILTNIKKIFEVPDALAKKPETSIILRIALGVVWGLLLMSTDTFDIDDFSVGEIAPYTVRSPIDVIIEDAEATQKAKTETAAAVKPIVDFFPNLAEELKLRTANAFEILRNDRLLNTQKRKAVEEAFGTELSDNVYKQLVAESNNLRIELVLKDAFSLMNTMQIAMEPSRWKVLYPNGVDLRASSDSTKQEMLSVTAFDQIISPDEAKQILKKRITERFSDSDRKNRDTLMQLVDALVAPNLLPNPAATIAAQEKAVEEVKPVLFRLQAGEVLIRSGEKIQVDQYKRLAKAYEQTGQMSNLLSLSAKILLVVLAVFLLLPYAKKPTWRDMGHPQDLVFLLIVSTMVLGLIRIARNLAEPLVFAIPELPPQAVYLILPFASLPLLFRLFFRRQVALSIAMLFSLVLSLFLEPITLILPFTLLGGIMGIRQLQHSKRRSEFQRAGLAIGITQSAIWILYAWVDVGITYQQMLYAIPIAFIGGIIASMLASSLAPFGEWFGRYVSEIRLLELAQDDQPLLKWLHINAPGTYNHSLSVARLAEAAAEKIGADSLLARVGAYYHDIGKGFWPQYFVENQRQGFNPHTKLKPQLSARVILAHVSQGIELAHKNHLPEVLVNFIPEHHGTSRIEYFYHQASDQATEKENIDDLTFRYPGPRPRSKETALLMLADVVESATRTLDNPTPDRIHAFVSRLVEKVFADNQLDESPLTLKDLSAAVYAFSDVLSGMYHQRIDYPHNLKPGGTEARAV